MEKPRLFSQPERVTMNFVALLVEHQANVNQADNSQRTALYYAGEHGYNEITEILLAAGAEG